MAELVIVPVEPRNRVAYAIRDAFNNRDRSEGDVQEWWFTATDAIIPIVAEEAAMVAKERMDEAVAYLQECPPSRREFEEGQKCASANILAAIRAKLGGGT